MRQSLRISMFTGPALMAMSVAGAIADEPPSQNVFTTPAPEAVLLDPESIDVTPRGAELTLQNDSLVAGGNAVLQFGFANGEIGAVTYNIDPALFPVKILRIQIFWQSALANGTPSLQDSIQIYTGNFNLFAILDSPAMIDGGLNEFDIASMNIIINDPTPITVGLKFFDAPNGVTEKGTLATDDNGCQNGLNWVFIPGQNNWFNLCSFGVAGDLIIRTIIDPMGAGIPCPADINGDGVIDTADLGLLIAVFGQAPPSIAEADINGDGVADTADLGILIAAFGTPCP